MRTFAILLGVAFAAAVAQADETCPTTETTLTLETPAGTYYVYNDLCQPACTFSLWIYQETNGIDGLQRCDELHECYSCQGDTIIF